MKKAIINSIKRVGKTSLTGLVLLACLSTAANAQTKKWSEKGRTAFAMYGVAFWSDFTYVGTSRGMYKKPTSENRGFALAAHISRNPVEELCSFKDALYFLEKRADNSLHLVRFKKHPQHNSLLRDNEFTIGGFEGRMRATKLMSYKGKLYIAAYDFTQADRKVGFLLVSEDGENFTRRDIPDLAAAVNDNGSPVAGPRKNPGIIRTMIPFDGKIILGCEHATVKHEIFTGRNSELKTRDQERGGTDIMMYLGKELYVIKKDPDKLLKLEEDGRLSRQESSDKENITWIEEEGNRREIVHFSYTTKGSYVIAKEGNRYHLYGRYVNIGKHIKTPKPSSPITTKKPKKNKTVPRTFKK